MAKVMLVEDDLTMVNLLRTFLQIEGYEVTALLPGENIVDSIITNNPDVILLDVHLKNIGEVEINGFELLEKFKSTDQLEGVKVIMTSGMDVRDRSASAGADGFLLKPYMPNDLIKLIEKVTK